jgi:hypothetical protein
LDCYQGWEWQKNSVSSSLSGRLHCAKRLSYSDRVGFAQAFCDTASEAVVAATLRPGRRIDQLNGRQVGLGPYAPDTPVFQLFHSDGLGNPHNTRPFLARICI